jgi:hypothetical protein
MKRSSRLGRTAATLPDSVHWQLNRYALAAGAAGVGMLALAQPVEAKIVYTPAHVKFSQFPPVILDLNHDGKGDFTLALGSGKATSFFVSGSAIVYGSLSGNQAIATAEGAYRPAVALRAGSPIGFGRLFNQGADLLARLGYHVGRGSSSTFWEGQWGNGGKGLKNRYLGLKFIINGKVHFGWARVTVATSRRTFTAILTGYAYETIANKSIRAGQTKGSEEIATSIENPLSLAAPAPESPTLGLLAMGSPGLSVWRRKESRGATE